MKRVTYKKGGVYGVFEIRDAFYLKDQPFKILSERSIIELTQQTGIIPCII